MCTDMLKGANIEGEDEREETIQDMEGLFCCQNCATLHLIMVRTDPGKPGKSGNFIMAFSRTGKSWKNCTGPGKFWKSVKLN